MIQDGHRGGTTMKNDLNTQGNGATQCHSLASASGFTARTQTRPANFDLLLFATMRRLLADARSGVIVLGFILFALALLAPPAHAKGGVPPPNGITVGPPTAPGGPVPFDITGAIDSFTVTTPGDDYSGGTIVVDGITVVIPRNLVITMPAAYFTTGQLFKASSGGITSTVSDLALRDNPPPIAAYEVSIAGNIVSNPTPTYIAGLVSIAQQSLNGANGIIKSINYAKGELCVGAAIGPCLPTDARVMINDAVGRYGLMNGTGLKESPDERFAVDTDNPTIHAASGYPMCIPRFDPAIQDDPDCPRNNRPIVGGVRLTTFVMDVNFLIPPAPFVGGAVSPCPGGCDDTKQAPMVVGDYIGYSGIMQIGANGAPYIAAYAIEANVGIFTRLGGPVYYMYMDAPLIGTGPSICPGNAECQARLKTTIFVTDPSRTPAMFAVDENPATGARTSRLLTSTLTNTAQLGRFVFVTDKDTTTLGLPNGGVTREIVARLATTPNGTPVNYLANYGNNLNDPHVKANGLVFGQYVSPVGEYIFPETNISGGIITPYNFRCLAFLTKGWAQGGALPNIGQLVPFPEAVAPAPGTVNCTF
jgi:hypothetical protein